MEYILHSIIKNFRLSIYVFFSLLLNITQTEAQTNSSTEENFDCPIQAIEKDNNGLMWIGTTCGLRTFDGYQYLKTGNLLDSLPITFLITDTTAHLIWASTSKGVYAIDYQSMRLIKKYPGTKKVETIIKSSRGNNVYAVLEDGTLWIIPPKGPVTSIKIPALILPDEMLHSEKRIVEDGDDLVFFSRNPDHTIHRFSLKTHKLTSNNVPSLIDVVTIDRYANTLIFCQWGVGVKLLDHATYTNITNPLIDSLNRLYGRNNIPQCFLAGDLLYIYFTNAPIWRLNLRTGIYDMFMDESQAISTHTVDNPIYVDEYQTLWIAQNSGMLRIKSRNDWFEKLLIKFPGLNFRHSTREIIEDTHGDLYIGSYSGMFKYASKEQSWSLYSSIIRRGEVQPTSQSSLLDDSARGYIYAGSEPHFFCRFNKKTNAFEADFYKLKGWNKPIDKIAGYCLLKDFTGKIWIGTSSGLASYDIDSGVVTLQKNNAFDIGNYRITYLYQSVNKRQIWLGTENGVYLLDIFNGLQKRFSVQSKPALSSNIVYCITEDIKGNLWVATDHGISIIDKAGKHIQYLNKGNSKLCNNVTYGMLWENYKIIWISTQNGLCRYNLANGYLTNYFEEDGICHNEFNRNSFFKSPAGKMYFGGISGITTFYPERIPDLPENIKIYVSGISIWNLNTNKDLPYNGSIKNGSEIVMEYSDKALTVSMGLSDYTAPKKNIFYYRIKNLYNSEMDVTW